MPYIVSLKTRLKETYSPEYPTKAEAIAWVDGVLYLTPHGASAAAFDASSVWEVGGMRFELLMKKFSK